LEAAVGSLPVSTDEFAANEYDDEYAAADTSVKCAPEEAATEQALFDRLAHAIESSDTRAVVAISGGVRPNFLNSAVPRQMFSGVEQLLGRGERPRHPGPLTHYLVAQETEPDIPLEQGRRLLREAAQRGAADDAPIELLVARVRELYIEREKVRHAECLRAEVERGATVDELVSVAEYAADELAVLKREVAVQTPLYTWVASDALDGSDYTLDYLIEGMLVAGQVLVLGGAAKAMKTSLMVDAAVSLSSGTDFLGQPVTRPCRVAVMSGESGLAVLQDIARRVCCARGISLADLSDKLIWTADLPKLGSADHLAPLEADLRTSRAEVLMVDPMYLCMPGAEASNLHIQGQYLREINDICRQLTVTLILVHHNKRNTGRASHEPAELFDLAWAGYAEFARQWWLMARREKYEPGTGMHRLWLTVGGSAGHSALWAVDIYEGLQSDAGGRVWKVTLTDAASAREAAQQQGQEADAAQLEADREAICVALASLADMTATLTAIRKASGLNSERLKPALESLVKDQRLVPTTIRKGNNRNYDAYRLNSCPDTSA
jgi:hypothetical protein